MEHGRGRGCIDNCRDGYEVRCLPGCDGTSYQASTKEVVALRLTQHLLARQGEARGRLAERGCQSKAHRLDNTSRCSIMGITSHGGACLVKKDMCLGRAVILPTTSPRSRLGYLGERRRRQRASERPAADSSRVQGGTSGTSKHRGFGTQCRSAYAAWPLRGSSEATRIISWI